MDDPRIEWIRNKAYLALDIRDHEVFEQLLERDDGEGERNIAKFINDTPTDDASSLLFYKVVCEEEEEMEVECGKQSFSYYIVLKTCYHDHIWHMILIHVAPSLNV